jgi:hypothetical protein
MQKSRAVLGCLPYMTLIGGTIPDQVQAKNSTDGNGKRQEQDEDVTKLPSKGKKHRKTTM